MSNSSRKVTPPNRSVVERVVAGTREYGWLLVGAALALALVPAERPSDPPEIVRYREEISKLGESEREQLKINYSTYKSLSPARRSQLAELHQQVSADPELRETFDAYQKLLSFLPREHYERITTTADPQARLELVRENQKLMSAPRPRWWSGGPFPRGFSGPDIRLKPHDFNAVMEVIAKRCEMPPFPADSSPQVLFEHHVLVMDEYLDRARKWSERFSKEPMGSVPSQPFDPNFLQDLIKAVSDPHDRSELEQWRVGNSRSEPDFSSRERRWYFARLLGRGLMEEGQRLRADPHVQSGIRETLASLDSEERAQLQRLPEDLRDVRLFQEYLRRHSPRIAEKLPHIQFLFAPPRTGEPEGDRPGRQFGPDRQRDGESQPRQRPEDRPEDRRPPDNRFPRQPRPDFRGPPPEGDRRDQDR